MAINLLPWRELARQTQRLQLWRQLRAATIATIAIWIIWQGYHVLILVTQNKKMQQLTQAQQHIATEFNHYHQLLTQQRIYADQQQYIQAARAQSRKLLALIATISANMPANVYLTRIEKHDDWLELTGKSPSHTDIALLLKYLETITQQQKDLHSETNHTDAATTDIDFTVKYPLGKQP